MKRKYVVRMLATMMAATLAMTAVPASGIEGIIDIVRAAEREAQYVTEGIDESLLTPFGLDKAYDAEQGIGFVWGYAGYDSYTVTISGKNTDYVKTYEHQGMGYKWYPDNYLPGKTYYIAIQGEQDGAYSPVAITEVTIPGEAVDEEEDTPVVDPSEISEFADLGEMTESTYRSELDGAWGGDKNVNFSFAGETATITGDNFGGGDWQVQWQLKEFASNASYNALEFDITSEVAGTLKYKLITDEGMTNIVVEAGQTQHVVIKTDRTNVKPFFDLSYLGAGKTVISNMKFAETSKPEVVETVDPNAINFDEIDHSVDYVDGGTDVKVTYDGTKIIATGSDWGNDWGGDSHWQVQLKEVISTPTNEKYRVSFNIKSEVERDVFIKLGDLKNDGTVYAESTVHVTAGLNKVSLETTKEVDIDDMMVLFALGTSYGSAQNTLTISNVVVKAIKPEGVKEDAISLAGAETELYVGTDWSGASAVVAEEDTKAILDVASYGWNGEWGLQYMVQNLGLVAGETYTVSVDLKSSIDKDIFFKLDDAGHIAERVSLVAGETLEYEKTVTVGEMKDQKLYFALGQMSGEAANRAGIFTISNLVIRDSQGKALTLGGGVAAGVIGPEYDFSDNTGDYADPGKNKDGYELIWADEFDGNYGNAKVDPATGLNLENWAYQLGDGSTDCGNYGWGNNELQCYTKDPKNIKVNEDLDGDGKADGLLRITASYEDKGITFGSESTKKYSSGRIRSTKGADALFNTTYGYIEGRISLPETQGAWPAFWMLPESTSIYGGWPVSGEIDILETVGARKDEACGTLHWGTPNHVYKGSGYVKLSSEMKYFHTYAIDWKPGQIDWIYDGKVIYTSTEWESGISGASDSLTFDAPFDEPFYAILNLAVDSGQFGGSANKASFKGDINMYVDYVRCFQKTAGYDDYATATVAVGSADDWKDYAGTNMIGDIAVDTLNGQGGGLDDSSADPAKWYLSNQDDAAGAALESFVDNNGKTWAVVNVAKAGGQDYSNQLIGHFNAKKGYTYKVSFDAYASGDLVGKTVNCDAKEYAGWSTYAVSNVKLNSTATNYAFAWNQTENFSNCRIEFNLGAQATGKVYISNVKVEIIDPASIEDVTGGRQVLAGGEMLYNSTFDQGAKHFGYWTAADGTVVSIPRYTTEDLTGHDVSVVDIASMTNYEHIANGIKYYERRAQISAAEGKVPMIYQSGFAMGADTYTGSFDLYSKTNTAVKVSIYTTDAEGNLVSEVASKVYAYNAADGVKKISYKFDTTSDIANAAIVFAFAKGTEVQLDNVHLLGAHQGVQVPENPIENGTSWRGDNGGGGEIALVNANGVITMNDIVSGGTWYSPQIGSENFALGAGVEYKLAFDYKMAGTSNNKFKYIVQQNGGSWIVVKDITEVEYNAANADSEGFNHYEVIFKSNVSQDDIHFNFGFGDSAAANASFSFKNFTLCKVAGASAGGNESVSDKDDSAIVDPSVFVQDEEKAPEKPEVNPGKNPEANPGKNPAANPGKNPAANPGKNPAVNPGKNPAANPGKKPAKKPVVEQEDDEVDVIIDPADVEEGTDDVIADEPADDNASDDKTIADDETPLAAEAASNGLAMGWLIAIIAAVVAIAGAASAFVLRRRNK